MAVLGVGAGTTVTAQMDADFYAGILGDKKMVLPIGRQMESELIDNNTVRIHDGVAIIQGRYIYVEANTYDEFKIENGAQGVNRYDIIGYHLYRMNGKEFCENVVTKDVGASGTVETEVFRDGGQEVFIPMYRVYLEGLNIKKIEPLFETLYTSAMVKKHLITLSDNIIAAHERAIERANGQIREYTDQLKLSDSEYFKIKTQKTLVNIRTGEVSVYITGSMLQTVAAGKSFIVANMQKFIPENDIVVPVTITSNLNNIGSMKGAMYPARHSAYQGVIRATVLNQVTKDGLVYVHVHYFVDAEELRELLGEQELRILPIYAELKPMT